MDYPKITEQDICEIEREDGFREEIIFKPPLTLIHLSRPDTSSNYYSFSMGVL